VAANATIPAALVVKVVARLIASVLNHFVFAVWRTKKTESVA
jgi:hypothetical protein